MTIGIGRKFGRRMIIATDTMISDRDTGRANSIPGRLKSIVLSPYVSVAYAGHADPALFTIRQARKRLLETHNIRDVASLLIEASSRSDIDVEFILAFHENGCPFMHKVTARGISDDLPECYIGDANIVRNVLKYEPLQSGTAHPDIGIQESETRFSHAFQALFNERGTQINHYVGGLPITLLASPYGHTYQGRALSMSWDTINLAIGITPAQHKAKRTGETAWSYNIIDGLLRGVPVLGVAIPQAGVGFVYSPLNTDEAEVIRVGVPDGPKFIDSKPLLNAVSARVEELSKADGNGIIELDAPWENTDSDAAH